MFNFRINNVAEKPIIDKGLFYIFKFVKEDSNRQYFEMSLVFFLFLLK